MSNPPGPVASRPYPLSRLERDRWIAAQRPPRPSLDPLNPAACFVESERVEDGRRVRVATVFLTNRECPWRCVMCDLWKHTLPDSAPPGAIPTQIDRALDQLQSQLGPSESCHHIKLYNSGSFFDPRAVSPEDDAAIAARVGRFERVIVESHPAFLGDRVRRFQDRLRQGGGHTELEVAMGLETAHPGVLEKLNKGMTVGQFRRAVAWLRAASIDVRAFILVRPPFMSEAEGLEWAKRSVDLALDAGATVCSLIPTRGGNGAMEVLARGGLFAPPRLATLEAALAYGIGLGRRRVFADLWDLEAFSDCRACFAQRRDRLQRMNLEQVVPAPVSCRACEVACES